MSPTVCSLQPRLHVLDGKAHWGCPHNLPIARVLKARLMVLLTRGWRMNMYVFMYMLYRLQSERRTGWGLISA